mmetsp:Transcript_69256/g.101496  ORF Transcript_69256/g.101496 Transcript_69256/m.101496 type:complete len:244 (+) Transcript_69256:818-1549(+)
MSQSSITLTPATTMSTRKPLTGEIWAPATMGNSSLTMTRQGRYTLKKSIHSSQTGDSNVSTEVVCVAGRQLRKWRISKERATHFAPWACQMALCEAKKTTQKCAPRFMSSKRKVSTTKVKCRNCPPCEKSRAGSENTCSSRESPSITNFSVSPKSDKTVINCGHNELRLVARAFTVAALCAPSLSMISGADPSPSSPATDDDGVAVTSAESCDESSSSASKSKPPPSSAIMRLLRVPCVAHTS